LLILLNRTMPKPVRAGGSLLRTTIAAAVSGAVVYLLMLVLSGTHPLVQSGVAMAAGAVTAVPLVWPELRLILRL